MEIVDTNQSIPKALTCDVCGFFLCICGVRREKRLRMKVFARWTFTCTRKMEVMPSHHHTITHRHTHTITGLCCVSVSHSGVVDCGMLLGVVVLWVVVCVELLSDDGTVTQALEEQASPEQAGEGHIRVLRLNVIYDQPEEFAVSPRSTSEQLSLWHSQ